MTYQEFIGGNTSSGANTQSRKSKLQTLRQQYKQERADVKAAMRQERAAAKQGVNDLKKLAREDYLWNKSEAKHRAKRIAAGLSPYDFLHPDPNAEPTALQFDAPDWFGDRSFNPPFYSIHAKPEDGGRMTYDEWESTLPLMPKGGFVMDGYTYHPTNTPGVYYTTEAWKHDGTHDSMGVDYYKIDLPEIPHLDYEWPRDPVKKPPRVPPTKPPITTTPNNTTPAPVLLPVDNTYTRNGNVSREDIRRAIDIQYGSSKSEEEKQKMVDEWMGGRSYPRTGVNPGQGGGIGTPINTSVPRDPNDRVGSPLFKKISPAEGWQQKLKDHQNRYGTDREQPKGDGFGGMFDRGPAYAEGGSLSPDIPPRLRNTVSRYYNEIRKTPYPVERKRIPYYRPARPGEGAVSNTKLPPLRKPTYNPAQPPQQGGGYWVPVDTATRPLPRPTIAPIDTSGVRQDTVVPYKPWMSDEELYLNTVW